MVLAGGADRAFAEAGGVGGAHRDSSVGTPTCYGLDGPGIESRWRRDFPHPSGPVLGPTQPHIQCVRGIFFGTKEAGGVVLTTHSHLTLRLKKE